METRATKSNNPRAKNKVFAKSKNPEENKGTEAANAGKTHGGNQD